MNKVVKYILYAVVCVALLLGFTEVFISGVKPSPANAFEWEKQVSVYFSNSQMGSNEDCSKACFYSVMTLKSPTLKSRA